MFHDDFNYATPQRETNWTLKNEGKRQTHLSSSSRQMNRTDDISGAQAGTTASFRAARFNHKPNLFVTGDISGASPTRQIPERVTKPNDRNINNRDIEHSYPESKLFSTPRVVNPLEPVYPLPVVRHRLPTPPVQKHDPMRINDIPGTHAKPPRTRVVERNPLDYSDVPLSRAGALSESRKRKTTSMNLDTQDINNGPVSLFKPRDTNPLNPQYTISLPTPSGASVKAVIGTVAGSRPREMPAARTDRPGLSLRSDDIDGAKPGGHLPYPKERREWKKTCDVSDIDTKGKRKLY
jgi:hypothetical protein